MDPTTVCCQRPNRSGQHRYPLAPRQAVPVYRVSQDVQRHQRHGLLPAPHLKPIISAKLYLAPRTRNILDLTWDQVDFEQE